MERAHVQSCPTFQTLAPVFFSRHKTAILFSDKVGNAVKSVVVTRPRNHCTVETQQHVPFILLLTYA
jgi:hypothetical protein